MTASSQFDVAHEALDQVRRLLLSPNTESLKSAVIELERAICAVRHADRHDPASGRFLQSLKTANALLDQGRVFNDALVSLINPPGDGYTRGGTKPETAAISAVVLDG